MRLKTRLQSACLIVLLSAAFIPLTRNEEVFCFRSESELGRTRCSFLRGPLGTESVLLYWSVWTSEHRVEECSISAETQRIQSYLSVCAERGVWDLYVASPPRLNLTLLLQPGSPCEVRQVAPGPPERAAPAAWQGTDWNAASAGRKRRKRAWIFPGTLWCGHGSRAGDYEQLGEELLCGNTHTPSTRCDAQHTELGMFEQVDRCCREHDHCDHIIRPFTVNFGVFNPIPFTISHCDCDHRFKQCLLGINDTVSNMVGYTFFNIFKLHCFELIQKKRCTKLNWIGMCTSDKVAPYAIFKDSTAYNATTSHVGIPEQPVYQGKPSTTAIQEKINLKQRKQSTSRKSYVPGASAAGHTLHLGEIIVQHYGKQNTVSSVPTTAQPKDLVSCNTTLFHQKSEPINRNTQFPAAPSSAPVHTTTSTASTKRMAATAKKITPSKRKNITHWPILTVQTKLMKGYKPSTCKMKGDPPRGDHFQSKQHRRNHCKQHNASLHDTVSPNFITLPPVSKLSKTNKSNGSMSGTKKKMNFPSRKNMSSVVSTRGRLRSGSKSEMKLNSAEISKQPKIGNKTNSARETLKPAVICDATRHLDDCKYRINPMQKLYGHQNSETTAIYHCDCIHRLTDNLKQVESIDLLKNLLWRFVSMSCIEIPKTKECTNNTRCSAILRKATELETTLVQLEGQRAVKNRQTSTNKRASNQLYKRCLRILHPRKKKHVKHSV